MPLAVGDTRLGNRLAVALRAVRVVPEVKLGGARRGELAKEAPAAGAARVALADPVALGLLGFDPEGGGEVAVPCRVLARGRVHIGVAVELAGAADNGVGGDGGLDAVGLVALSRHVLGRLSRRLVEVPREEHGVDVAVEGVERRRGHNLSVREGPPRRHRPLTRRVQRCLDPHRGLGGAAARLEPVGQVRRLECRPHELGGGGRGDDTHVAAVGPHVLVLNQILGVKGELEGGVLAGRPVVHHLELGRLGELVVGHGVHALGVLVDDELGAGHVLGHVPKVVGETRDLRRRQRARVLTEAVDGAVDDVVAQAPAPRPPDPQLGVGALVGGGGGLAPLRAVDVEPQHLVRLVEREGDVVPLAVGHVDLGQDLAVACRRVRVVPEVKLGEATRGDLGEVAPAPATARVALAHKDTALGGGLEVQGDGHVAVPLGVPPCDGVHVRRLAVELPGAAEHTGDGGGGHGGPVVVVARGVRGVDIVKHLVQVPRNRHTLVLGVKHVVGADVVASVVAAHAESERHVFSGFRHIAESHPHHRLVRVAARLFDPLLLLLRLHQNAEVATVGVHLSRRNVRTRVDDHTDGEVGVRLVAVVAQQHLHLLHLGGLRGDGALVPVPVNLLHGHVGGVHTHHHLPTLRLNGAPAKPVRQRPDLRAGQRARVLTEAVDGGHRRVVAQAPAPHTAHPQLRVRPLVGRRDRVCLLKTVNIDAQRLVRLAQ